MYKILPADKDTYITDRVVEGERKTSANVGGAASLDLFKLYGYTQSGSNPNIELSRLLVHFDLDPLRDLVTAGKLDINNGSFTCNLKLFDVYNGQPTPRDFDVTVHPLSRSFDEGLGRDIVFYGDVDTANFLTGSRTDGPWILSGANSGGPAASPVDYIAPYEVVQHFTTGEEDLNVDVTAAIRDMLSGTIPDKGFRISLTSSLEVDNRTYFVKRFGGRIAYNSDKHPQLIVKFDDSIQDDTSNLTFDEASNFFLYNYVHGTPTNITGVSGSNCIGLNMVTEVSGGYLTFGFTGSQHTFGVNPAPGIYSASVEIPLSDARLIEKLALSGTVKFIPVWASLPDTGGYVTGSAVYVVPASRGATTIEPKRYTVSVTGLKPDLDITEITSLRVNIFDEGSPRIFKVKTPVELPGLIIHDVFYSVRDAATDAIRVPFDRTKKSTRVSSDAQSMYFRLDASNLVPGRAYVIDILIATDGNEQVYRNASPSFRVVDLG